MLLPRRLVADSAKCLVTRPRAPRQTLLVVPVPRTRHYSIPPSVKRRFTKSHEWISAEGGAATIGITDHAQKALGEVVFVEAPEVGREVAPGDVISAVESVKAASDINSPASGSIVEANDALTSNPDLINKSPADQGWICKLELKDESELDALMDEKTYNEFVEGEGS